MESPATQELEQALALAEKAEEKGERLRRHILGLRAGQFVTALVWLTLIWAGASANAPRTAATGESWRLILLASVPLGAAFFALRSEKRRQEKKLRVERLVLAETLNLLRQAEPLISRRRDWSRLKKAGFRIRLSRCGVDAQTLP